MKRFVLFVILLAILGGGAYIAGKIFFDIQNPGAIPVTPPKDDSARLKLVREVLFPATDGYYLRGTIYPSDHEGRQPAIVLAHQLLGNRHDFDSFIPRLREAGYAVLAYDARGYGESLQSVHLADIRDFDKDILGAVAFLKARADVDPKRIGVVGASANGAAAFLAAASSPDIVGIALLSPVFGGISGRLDVSKAMSQPRNVFIAANEKESSSSIAIYDRAAQPKEREIYAGFGHGKLLLQSQDATRDILKFLADLFSE